MSYGKQLQSTSFLVGNIILAQQLWQTESKSELIEPRDASFYTQGHNCKTTAVVRRVGNLAFREYVMDLMSIAQAFEHVRSKEIGVAALNAPIQYSRGPVANSQSMGQSAAHGGARIKWRRKPGPSQRLGSCLHLLERISSLESTRQWRALAADWMRGG
eukprot:CAMPEP_0172466910 /NCGR_PEP_ID=MMETSP1065-20121228/57423_1 /TAXON_ID=265537 /ORGANISM="Amphiprora paludosa, Strain CCMP125" /LENGTH=158 /DNA_ID=CAMNT_0013223879 /DNA_START=1196 /DNA_END=1673 /DNA_ORIENTATION=+